MKHSKKLLSLLLMLAMILSLGDGYVAQAATQAAESITVTLRIEQDEDTLLTPVQVTLTDEDKDTDYGIDLIGTGDDATLSPLRALAKYLSTVKGVSDDDMSDYIIVEESTYGAYVNGLSMTGDGVGSASTTGADNVSWMYYVNDIYADVAMDQYTLSDNDSVVFYGLWYSYDGDETLYGTFDKSSYDATLSNGTATVDVTLNGKGIEYDYTTWEATAYTKAVSGASVYVADDTSEGSYATASNATSTVVTDDTGKASLTFTKAGTYVLSASRKAADGTHCDISRPYATVTVSEETSNESTAIITPSVSNDNTAPTVKKVKKLKAKIKNKKAKKKNIRLSWKKQSKASGYQVKISKKKKKGYKKLANTKKNKLTFKRKKGTYYVKVRAYKKQNNKTYWGTYSKVLKIKL